MHILYADDSGSPRNANEKYFVLGGLSVFERGIYHQIIAADRCVEQFGLGDPSEIELHGTSMYNGRDGVWRSVKERPRREEMIKKALATIEHAGSVRLFAVAVDKEAVSPEDPVQLAFEELCNRFNMYLTRQMNRRGERQKGLVIMDESKDEKPLQTLARNFRSHGGRWGKFAHLAEVPLFVDSRATRLIQISDLVAYATWRKYEHSDGRFFDSLLPKFDAEGGVLHGLVHRKGRFTEQCFCPACYSRKWGSLAR